MDFDLANVDALQDAQRNVAAGGASAPDLPVEIRLRVNLFTPHGKDNVALLHAGTLRRTLWRHANHEQATLQFIGG